MFPLIAVGAFITGTLVVGASAASSSRTSESKRSPPPPRDPVVSPQAYVIVPVAGDKPDRPDRKDTPSVVDLVGKMLF